MLLRRYGTTLESVETNFDSKALTEIGFRRDRRHSIPWNDFQGEWERVAGHELSATAEGDVHDEAEQRLLADLEAQLTRLRAGLGEGEILVVESEQGTDYPKTRSIHKNVVVDGHNRLYFHVGVEPPLRIGVYRKAVR